MRVLTVQQPWAWAIFHGKGIENRTQLWKYRGPVAIHAGTRWSERGEDSGLVQAAWESVHGVPANPFARALALMHDDWPMGAILGVVDLADAHHEEGGCCAPWGEQSYVEHGGKVRKQIVHMVLENPREFDRPIRNVRGRLGLWTPDFDLTAEIEARLAA